MFFWLKSVITVIGIAVVGLYISRKIGLLDRPGPDIIPPRKPVPTLQGIFLYVTLLVVVMQFPSVAYHKATITLLIGGGVMVFLNFLDEVLAIREAKRQGSPYLIDVIPSWSKLIVQASVLVSVVYFGDLYRLDIMGHAMPVWLGFVGAVVWFMVFINAINWFDYAHGQASGLSAIGYASIVALVQGVIIPSFPGIDYEQRILLDVVTVLGVLLFILSVVYTVVEYRPFGLLRDVGSRFYGFSLAYLALLGGAKVGTIMVVLSLPLFDFVRVILNRIFVMKKNPLKGDYTHFHHRLLLLGRTKNELRRFIRVRSAMMSVLMLLQGENRWAKLIIFVMMACVFFGLHIYFYRIKKVPFELSTIKKGASHKEVSV